jgi:hypothetical protein
MKEKYILLRDATKFCNYSQSYLSLRARQGKLKAKKIGRNWVTTKEWLQAYLDNVADKNNRKEITKPPDNLPVESRKNKLVIPKVSLPLSPLVPIFSLGFVLFALLTIFLIIPKDISLQSVFEKAKNLREEIVITAGFISTEDTQASTFEAFKNYKDWVVEGIADRLVKIKSGEYFSLTKGKIVQEESKIEETVLEKEIEIPETKEGMVMFSSEEKNEIEKKIMDSFSDRVEIKPEDEISGMIIPIFKEGRGQEYFYIMVPINE